MSFAEAIYRRKDLSWNELMRTNIHGLGCETIRKGLRVERPEIANGKKIIAFRFHENKPMVGFMEKDVFYVLWFDRNCDVYNH